MTSINVTKLRQTIRLIHCLQKERGATCAASAALSYNPNNNNPSSSMSDNNNPYEYSDDSSDDNYDRKETTTFHPTTADVLLEITNRGRRATDGALSTLCRTDDKLIKFRDALIRIRSIFNVETLECVNFRRIFVAFNSLIGHIIHEQIVVAYSCREEEEEEGDKDDCRRGGNRRRISSASFTNRKKNSPTTNSGSNAKSTSNLFSRRTTERQRSLSYDELPRKSNTDNSPSEKSSSPHSRKPPRSSRCRRPSTEQQESKPTKEQILSNTSSLISLLLAFTRLKESSGIERGFLSALLVLPNDTISIKNEWELLLNDLVLELENQHSKVCQLREKAKEVEEVDKREGGYRYLLALVEQSVEMGGELCVLHNLVRKDFDLEAFRKAVTMEKFWGMITLYIDRIHALELLIIEEVESIQSLSSTELVPSSPAAGVPPSSLDYSVPEQPPIQRTNSNDWEINLYELKFLRRIGRGAAGTTYYAKWRGEEVAVKVAATTELGLDGYNSEIKSLRRLHHPNIIRLLGSSYSEMPKTNCLVLEYCNAGDLDSALRQATPPKFFWMAAKGIANGMAYLHDKNVMHRDIKPDNVLLHGDVVNEKFVVKVTDFGLAVASREKEYSAETGTYRYMAPEIIRHETYSLSSDVYSFGVVLWQMITREDPFTDLGQIEAAGHVAFEKGRPPFPKDIPESIELLIRNCWDDDAKRRPVFRDICERLQCLEDELTMKEKEWMKAKYGHQVYNNSNEEGRQRMVAKKDNVEEMQHKKKKKSKKSFWRRLSSTGASF